MTTRDPRHDDTPVEPDAMSRAEHRDPVATDRAVAAAPVAVGLAVPASPSPSSQELPVASNAQGGRVPAVADPAGAAAPRLGAVEWAVLGASVVLAGAALSFAATDGLMDPQGHLTRHLHSTGNDDDLCVLAGAPSFGAVALLSPWFPGRDWAVALKGGAFMAAWGLQLMLLTWIEVGSITHTISAGGNLPLAVFVLGVRFAPLVMAGLALKIGVERVRQGLGR